MKKVISKVLTLALTLAMAGTIAGCSANTSDATVLRVGMECGYAPYNWTQSDDSNGAVPIADTSEYANGYDVMMAQKIADELGLTLEIYKIDWDSLPVAVQSGKIDAVIAGQSITSERLETVDFTTPYYYASVVVLTREDSAYASATKLEDLAGAVATSQINTIWYDVALPQIPDVQANPAMETVPNMIVALQSGAIDLVVTDMPAAMAAVSADPTLKLLALEDGGFEVSDEDVNIGISLQKGNDELCDAINSVLATMTVEDFEAMMDEAIQNQPLSN